MITASNYFEEVERIGVDTLTGTLKKGHDFVVTSTQGGTDWSSYDNNPNIKRVIGLYFQKLSDYIGSTTNKPELPSAEKSSPPKQGKVNKGRKTKSKVAAPIKIKATKKAVTYKVKEVEHIREEVKFIKRYVGLHNKMKSPNAILAFVKALQRSIVQKLIRKTSPLAKDIEMIQLKLIQVFNKMKGDETFAINEKDLNRLVAIAGGEQVYHSITVIKRFIGMQGKSDENKIHSFIKYMENLVQKGKLSKDDPYADKVNAIYKAIKQRTSSKISISKAELNGLEGIVKECGCKPDLGRIYNTSGKKLRRCKSKTYSDASRGACSHNKGLNGVLTAEEMANRKLDVLRFFSVWLSVFGNPAKNFVMMFHGEPHNGKTILLLKFAQFLAEHFGKVLYVSSEEFASTTMSSKVNELLKPFPSRLAFAGSLKDTDLSQYDFIILDSVNDLGLKVNEYKTLREQYPDKAFILILQHTKSGTFKGGKDWEHIPEIVGEVKKGVITVTKNRYGPKNVFDFFKYFGLVWEEPAQNLLNISKPCPDDMVTRDDNHY